MNPRDEDSERREHTREVSPWEWVAATFGLLLVLGSAGFLGWQEMHGDSAPPAIVLQLERTIAIEDSHLVEFAARNTGGSTVAALHVSGELLQGDSVVESSEAVLDFVPAAGSRAGGLFFENDPAGYELRLRPVGYDQP